MDRSNFLPLSITAITLIACIKVSNCQESHEKKILTPPDISNLLNNKELQSLGEKLFFDTNLSNPEGQSCAACHGKEVGWTGPDEIVNKTGGVYPGARHERYGNRKPNSSAYATFSPLFGYFKSLGEIVHFYNTRDVLPSADKVANPKPGVNCWPEPEISANMNKTELGNLGLTAAEESAIVEFMKTLSDGYVLRDK